MKRPAILFFLFLAIAFNSNGQSAFVLEGTVGKYPIVMKLSDEDPAYFYKSTKRDINLGISNGKNDSIVLKKTEYVNNHSKEIALETFVLRRTGNEWKGSWKAANGNALPVILKPIDTARYNFKSVPDLDFKSDIERIYIKTRLAGLVFIKDSVTFSGKYGVQWIHEKMSKLRGLRLVAGYDSLHLKKLNDVLSKIQFSHLQAYFTCSGTDGGFDYNLSLQTPFFSPQFVSVESYNYFFCSGAHPGFGSSSFTLDVKSGREIDDIDELYWFTGKKPVAEKDAQYYDYIDRRTKSLVAILTKLYPKEMKKPVSHDSCDYSDPSIWKFPSWRLTAKGLYLSPTVPHSSHVCDSPEFSVVPYALLAAYKNPERQ